MVTAVRMNEWASIRFMFGRRFKTAVGSLLHYDVCHDHARPDPGHPAWHIARRGGVPEQDRQHRNRQCRKWTRKSSAEGHRDGGKVPACARGFFDRPAVLRGHRPFNEAFANLGDTHALILSMRGVPLIDTSGMEAIHRLHENSWQGGTLMLAGFTIMPGYDGARRPGGCHRRE